MSADRTDELTDAEFEYEFLQDVAFKQWMREIESSNNPIDPTRNDFDKQFSMNEEEYTEIMELNERGEFVDFEIPADAPQGKKYSEMQLARNAEDDEFIPVDPSQEWSG